MLLAFAHVLEATAQDDAIDVLDLLVENVLDRAEADGERAPYGRPAVCSSPGKRIPGERG